MLQAPVFECFSFDPFPFQQDALPVPVVDIGGCEVLQAFVIAPVIVMADERVDPGFEIAGTPRGGAGGNEPSDSVTKAVSAIA